MNNLKKATPPNLHPYILQRANEWAEKLQGTMPNNINALGLSIDLETPVTCAAGLFSIGMVPFNEDTNEIYGGATFYARVRFAEVIDAGHVSGGTMRWWMEADNGPRYEIVKNQKDAQPYQLGVADAMGFMYALGNFLQPRGMLMPMGNSARFDVGGFESTALALGLVPKNENGEKQLPWLYWNELDLRQRVLDCKLFAGVNMKDAIQRTGTHHNAVDDAIHQAKMYLGAGLCIAGKRDVLQGKELLNWGL